MNKKLPADAFAHYLALGVERSYERVAEHFGVSKRTVTAAAARENWQQRVAEAEGKARDKAAESYVETVQQMNERHLKVLRFLLSRGVEGLKNLSVENFGDAVRAISTAIEKERLIRGEATDRTESLEAIIKRETERFLTTSDEDEWDDGDMQPAGEKDAGASEAPAA